ncbi:nuclear transport factor 2 family protein [Streptomyces sp. NPDC094143]|uniref:nuclear transport factor 2 family protein n=1 Tax=Streptomyces sp. NPDC094143 TaxID=3155310 RepID=UPI00332B4634
MSFTRRHRTLLAAALLAAVVTTSATAVNASADASAAPGTRTAPAHQSAREVANTKAAVALLEGAFTRHDPRTYALRYIDAETYIQHNPNFDNGRDAFIKGITHFVEQYPESSVTVKRTIAQGDLVVVQTLFRTDPADRGTAVADTFRFNQRGKIVEHWDVLQPIAPTTANGNPQI